MNESTLRRQLVRLILVRATISTILLGSAVVVRIQTPHSFAVDPFFFLIGLTYGLTIIYALTLRFVDGHRWLVDLQLGGDALIVSAFIYFTGGVTSYFTSLYVLPIIAASTIQFRRGGLLVATLSTVLYGGLVLAQYLAAEGLRTDPWLTAYVQALNQHVIDSLPSGLATTDEALHILTFNRGAEAITGVPCQAAVGRSI